MQLSLFIADNPEIILATDFNTVTLIADLYVDMFHSLSHSAFGAVRFTCVHRRQFPQYLQSHPSRELCTCLVAPITMLEVGNVG